MSSMPMTQAQQAGLGQGFNTAALAGSLQESTNIAQLCNPGLWVALAHMQEQTAGPYMMQLAQYLAANSIAVPNAPTGRDLAGKAVLWALGIGDGPWDFEVQRKLGNWVEPKPPVEHWLISLCLFFHDIIEGMLR